MMTLTVKNRPAITRLARKSLAANRARNRVAVAAITLTTLLFTALFTIALCLADTFQQQTFRQVGGDAHGGFKDLTAAQLDELKTDPLIVKYGTRLMLGCPTDPPFNKAHVEISYMDAINAAGSFCVPEQGTLPAEGSDQIACDTRLLSLLGVTPEIGAKVTLSYQLGYDTGAPQTVTDTFTLSGWWAYDPANTASMALVPRSYAEKVLAGYTSALPEMDGTGKWTLNVYLKSTAHIEKDLRTILANHGWQCDNRSAKDYIAIGVNWAFLSSQFAAKADPTSVIGLTGLLAVIILTGYLIIYNVFQISVSSDIRFYGLLKTIGTTPRQLRRLVRCQALTLSLLGIPLGLALGYGVGSALAPLVKATLSVNKIYQSTSPLIFVGATVFSLATVLISCARPGRLAGKVSPIEAVRYTEGNSTPKKGQRHTKNGGRPQGMALANLSRSPKKTVLVVLSLSLAVVLLQITYTLSIGFDMNKYLDKWVVSDFILSDAGYFQSHSDSSFSQQAIDAVNDTGYLREGGRVYQWVTAECFEPEEIYRSQYAGYFTSEQLDRRLASLGKDDNGGLENPTSLYGMEPFALKQLTTVEGDLSALYDPTQNAIAAVYHTDDYGAVEPGSNYAHPGDAIVLRYVDEWLTYDTRTGEAVANPSDTDDAYHNVRPGKWHDVTYTVAASVTMRNTMGFRYYGNPQFVLNPSVLQRDGGTLLLNYLFDTQPAHTADMEHFLEAYTTNVDAGLDYESKQGYVRQFEQMRQMFLLLGGALSAVVALVGVLNFFNAIITSILDRRHEFAVLQAVGMTGRQLKTMLVYEGLLYAVMAGGTSFVLCLACSAALQVVLGKILWFFTAHFTLLPLAVLFPIFVILGILLPLLCYRFANRQTIVERLRQTE